MKTLAVLLAALTSDSLTFHGEFWDLDEVPMVHQPVQKPYPPLWYPGNIEVAGPRGFNTIVGGPIERLTAATARFKELSLNQHENKSGLSNGAIQSIGVSVRIFLDEDERRAQERGRVAWKHFDENITKLWHQFGIKNLTRNPNADGDFDKALSNCLAFAGTPNMFIDFISERAEVGIDPLIFAFNWGDLDANEVRHSFDLFVEYVMPNTINL